MIDYIKIEINDNILIEKIRVNELLKYIKVTQKANNYTGELYYIYSYYYQKLKFTIIADNKDNSKQLFIDGSLHYYYNKGLHNANNFTYADFLGVMNDLKDKFNINPFECIIRSLEYGVNIKPLNFQTRLILQKTFYHQRKKFIEPINKPYKQSGNPKENDYLIKIYDKHFQFPTYTNSELLRFELKYCRMRQLNKMSIIHLSDLILRNNHFKLYDLLVQRFKEILFYDFTIETKKLTTVQQKNNVNYSNGDYWENLILKANKNRNSSNNFYHHKKRLKSFIENHSENIQIKLCHIIEYKRFKLLNIGVFNGFQKEKKLYKYPTNKKKKYCAYTHLYIGGFRNTISQSAKEAKNYFKTESNDDVLEVEKHIEKDNKPKLYDLSKIDKIRKIY